MSDTLERPLTAEDRANLPLTVKRIRRRAEQLATLTRPGAFRRRRFALANTILAQIADGQIADAQAAARAYVESVPEEPAAEPTPPATDTVA